MKLPFLQVLLVQEVLKKSLTSLKRHGKPEDKDDAIAVMERISTEIENAGHQQTKENVMILTTDCVADDSMEVDGVAAGDV